MKCFLDDGSTRERSAKQYINAIEAAKGNTRESRSLSQQARMLLESDTDTGLSIHHQTFSWMLPHSPDKVSTQSRGVIALRATSCDQDKPFGR